MLEITFDFFLIVLKKTFEHMQLTFFALFFAMMISIPLGICLAKTKRQKLANATIKLLSLMQTVPSLALIALLVSILVIIRPVIALPTIGFFPAVFVLAIYALLPITSNTYRGILQVDRTVVEVAKAMGMRNRQILFSIELPLSMKVLMGGIRLSLVWTVGMATLTSLVGAGGLGDLIMQGLRSMQVSLILAGTLPAALLAIVLDGMVGLLENWMTVKISETRGQKAV